jgi:drug/metabolite transporter (DMT)-like permease
VVGIAVLIALSGVVLVVRPAHLFGLDGSVLSSIAARGGPGPPATAASAITSALAASLAMMMLRRAGRTENAEAIAFHYSLFAAATTGAIALTDLRMPSSRDLACMLAAGLSGGVGQLAMTRAYKLERAVRVGGLSYLAPVSSALLGAAILHERPGPSAIAGMFLVILGGLLITLSGASRSSDQGGART